MKVIKQSPESVFYNWRTFKSPSKYNKSRTFGRNNTFFRYKKQRIRPIYSHGLKLRLCAGCSQPVKWPAGARRPAGRIAKAGWRSRGARLCTGCESVCASWADPHVNKPMCNLCIANLHKPKGLRRQATWPRLALHVQTSAQVTHSWLTIGGVVVIDCFFEK